MHGRTERDAAGRTLEHAVAALVPALVGHLARLVPLTELIRQSIDLDVLVADVDLDANRRQDRPRRRGRASTSTPSWTGST